ncbi:MAG: DJ-1/PfpI family protein [Candidatus Micrarchaeota archaeon]|nr:DJ-1/PfpI family protein [Candidatus Micrarchaeota archaeon]
MNKILMIVAPINFRDEELFEPKNIFETNGLIVDIAAKDVNKAKGMLGATVDIKFRLKEVNVEEYDAVIFVGGSGATVYFYDEEAHRILRRAYELKKIIGGICIAPSILANSGILKGKKATSFPSEKDSLIKMGVEYSGEAVTVDGNIVTANGPKAAKKFGEEIIKLLMQKNKG